MRTYPMMPGVPAAGHVTSGGFWHPGSERGCVKCPSTDPTTWRCWRNPAHRTSTHPRLGWPTCAECGAKPNYPERHRLLSPNLALGVHVPTASAAWTGAIVAPGSAIVALDPNPGEGRTVIYYEGWIYGAAQYDDRDARGRWQAGVEQAASRLTTGYPTSATAFVPVADLVRVGDFRPRGRSLVVHDEDALRAWLDT